MARRPVATSMALACAAAVLVSACASSGVAPRATEGADTRVASDADVQAALTRSCYGCHSDSGSLSWQAKLAPSAWFVGSAREKLNFSTWQSLDADRRSDASRSIQRVVSGGEMPPWDSALFDATEKLSPTEKERVATWASEAASGAIR